MPTLSPNGGNCGNGRTAGGRFAPGNPGGPGNPYARRVAALRSALALARSCGLVPWALDVRGVRGGARRDSRGPARPTVAAAFRPAGAARDPLAAARDVALLAVLYDLELRRAEAVGLCAGDVDLAGARLTLRPPPPWPPRLGETALVASLITRARDGRP